MLTRKQARLALALFDCKAVEFGAFKLKLHEKNPDAPLSPIYFNLRTADNPKPGPLTPEILSLAGQCLCQLVVEQDLVFDCVAGIPNAGDPFANAFMEAAKGARNPPQLLTLRKETRGENRVIAGIKDGSATHKRVLLLDDLITLADTKLEAALAIEADCGIVAGFIVLIDREQGGVEILRDSRYSFSSVFTITNLLHYYVSEHLITADKREEVFTYISQS